MFKLTHLLLTVLLVVPDASAIKCYATNPDPTLAPIKNETDISGYTYCFRWKMTCTTALINVDKLCMNATADESRTVYNSGNQVGLDFMRNNAGIFLELSSCSMDFCNYNTAPLKCYTSHPDGKSSPIKYEVQAPIGTLCVRYKHTCTKEAIAVDTGCKDAIVDSIKDVYTMVSNATFQQMKGVPGMYKDVFGCSTEYCNGAVPSSIKCYNTHSDGKSAPIRNTTTIVGASVCIRRKLNCTASAIAEVPTCKNATIGALRNVYEAVTSEMFEEMKLQTSLYLDVSGCSTDYCNYAEEASTTTVAVGFSATVTASPTPKSAAYVLQDPMGGWLVMAYFFLFGQGWL